MADEVLFQDPTQLKMSDEEYELMIAITYLLTARNKVGITDKTELDGSIENCRRNNKHVIRYAFEIYKTWASLFPQERKQFIKNTEHELDIERPVKQAIKAGGYSPISFPMRLDKMFHTLMPGIKTQDRRFWEPLLSYIPELRRSNYV